MKNALLISLLTLSLFSCKKKDSDKTPDETSSATTGSTTNPPPNYMVNGYFLLNKTYGYTIAGNDTLYSKSFFANANIYTTAVNILTSIGNDEYSGTLHCNADTMFYSSGSGYNSFPVPPTPPITWGFSYSPVFGTNTVTVSDTCPNLSKANVFAIPDSIHINQNLVLDLNTITTPFSLCTIMYPTGMKTGNPGMDSVYVAASQLVSQVPDSVYVTFSLSTDTYKTVNGKSILFRNLGNYTKTIKVVP